MSENTKNHFMSKNPRQIPIKKNDYDDVIRKYLKDENISSVDMIKSLTQCLGYFFMSYKIDFLADLEKLVAENDPISTAVGFSLDLMISIQDKALEKQNELPPTP